MGDLKVELCACMEANPKLQLSDAVYATLRNEIISFHIKPGSKLLISHLAEELAISMTPVREAMARLADDNLVTMSKSKKAYVATFDQEAYNNLQYFRMTLESLAIRQLCERCTTEDMDRLVACCEEIEYICYNELDGTEETLGRLSDADMRFHRQLVLASQNSRLIELYEQAIPRAVFFRRFFHPVMTAPYSFPQLHRYIVESITHGDEKLAVESLHFHYRAGGNFRLFSEL